MTTTTIAGSKAPTGSGTGAKDTVTSVVVDPVTGSTSVVTVPAQGSPTDSCVDPITGLPADASTCVAAAQADAGAVGANPSNGSPSGGQVAPTVAPPANPTVVTSGGGPSTTQIAWWLVQGASVCGVGVAVAGVRRKAA